MSSETKNVAAGEPAGWLYQFKTSQPIFMLEKRDWATPTSGWTETVLFAAPAMTEQNKQSSQPFAWYWYDQHGCLYITGDDRKPDLPADAQPLYATEQNKQSDTPVIEHHVEPSTAFAEWLNAGPGIAKAAGIEVEIVAITAEGGTLKLTSAGFPETTLETRPVAFEVLDTDEGVYLTRSEIAVQRTGYEYNGLYRRDSAGAKANPSPQARAASPMPETTPVSETDGAAISERVGR